MTPSPSEPDATGFVLAGGRSSRMGTDKALLEFNGRPLIAHAMGVLKDAGLPVVIAGARPEACRQLESYAPVVPDFETELGPLGGICAALAVSTTEYAVILPVDLPLLPSCLVARLLLHARITEAAVTLAAVNGLPQTFPAVLSRQILPTLQENIHQRRLGCLAAFRTAGGHGRSLSAVSAEVLVQSGQISHPYGIPVIRWFLNLNDKQDLRRASMVGRFA